MITAASLQSACTRWRVPLALALLMILLELGGDLLGARLAFDRHGLGQGQIWRLFSAHLVHLGPMHLALNLLGLLALLLLCPQPLSVLEWTRRLLLIGVLVSSALYVGAPQLDRYVGFSGVLHGLFLLGLLPLARRGDRLAWVCLLFLFAKLAWEMLFGAPLSEARAIGGSVVTESHLFGTLAGLAYGLWFGTFKKGETPQ